MITGEEYRASLFDGRATFFEGKRVDDLPGHPVLGSCVDRVAEGYDWLATQAVDGVSPIMGVPTSPDELRHKVEVVHHAGMMLLKMGRLATELAGLVTARRRIGALTFA